MPEKTYTLTELITNLRTAHERDRERLDAEGIALDVRTMGWVTGALLGYHLTDDDADEVGRFDADLAALGL